jgi:hypothetical protein
MHPHWFIFAAFVSFHAAAGFFSPELLAPVAAGSTYLPLLPLEAVSVPVFAPAESGGWASPSLFGWLVVVSLWSTLWLVRATFLPRFFRKEAWLSLTTLGHSG